MIFHTFIYLTEAVALLAGHAVDEPTDNFKLEVHSPSNVNSVSLMSDLHCESEYTVIITIDDVAVMSAYLLSSIAVQVFSA